MRALALEGEERAFEVAAEDVGAGCHLLAHGADVAADHVHRVDDEREDLAGGAVDRVAGAGHAGAVRGRSARGHDHTTRVRDHPIPGLLVAGVHLVRPADRDRLGLASQRRGHAHDDFTS